MNRRKFENWVYRKLIAAGWQVQRVVPPPDCWLPAHAYWKPDYIRRLGFRPGTIIDVGVARGTADLYNAFPDAYLLLIEPVAEFTPDIQAILASRPGALVPVALGAQPGERELRIEPNRPLLTSFYEREVNEQTGDDPLLRRIPVATLDSILETRDCPRPYGLKIDAEGAELEIIRGAAAVLRHTEFVIAEVSVPRRFHGGYRFADLIAALDAHGFEAVDFLDIGRDTASFVTFTDFVFRRKKD